MMPDPDQLTSFNFGAAVILAAILAAILTTCLVSCLDFIRKLRQRRRDG
jgi:hypothetical protein